MFGILQALGELLQSGLGKSQCRSLGRPTQWPPDNHQAEWQGRQSQIRGSALKTQTHHTDL